MKFFFLLAFMPTICFSQTNDSTTNKTKLGGLNIKEGIIIKKEFTDLAKYGGNSIFDLEFQILKITDARSEQIIKGIYVSYYNDGQHIAYIDADEIPGLIKFLEFIIKASTESADFGGKGIEYDYNCRDLKLAMYNSKPEYGSKAKRIYSWNYVIKVDFYSSSRFEFKLKDLQDLLGKLQNNISEFQ